MGYTADDQQALLGLQPRVGRRHDLELIVEQGAGLIAEAGIDQDDVDRGAGQDSRRRRIIRGTMQLDLAIDGAQCGLQLLGGSQVGCVIIID